MLKILTFCFFQAKYGIEINKKTESAKTEFALLLITIVACPLIIGPLIHLTDIFGVIDFLELIWPFDYGRVHSKNFISPHAVISIIAGLGFYSYLKYYFRKKNVSEELNRLLNNDSRNYLAKKYLLVPCLLFIVNIVFSLALIKGVWSLVFIFIALYIFMEVITRKEFSLDK